LLSKIFIRKHRAEQLMFYLLLQQKAYGLNLKIKRTKL